MTATVFENYTRAQLDAQYDNRGKVKDYEAYLQRFIDDSAEVRKRIPGELNIQFGDSAAETLDLFGTDIQGAAPLHVFFHGGYWKALSKDEFSYVANAFYTHKIRTAVVNYALIPDVDMAELIRQCRAALAYLWRNAATLGVDQNRIDISGHSAGGHITGMMMATDWPAFSHDLPPQIINSGVSLSGLMDLRPIARCFLNDDLHLDEDAVAQYSPLQRRPSASRPFLLLVGGDEGAEYHRQSESLVGAWQNDSHAVQMRSLPGHNHFSIVAPYNDPDHAIAQQIRDFANA